MYEGEIRRGKVGYRGVGYCVCGGVTVARVKSVSKPQQPAWLPALSDHRRVAVLLAALMVGVFLPAVTCGFVNIDDDRYVFRNPLVLGGLSADGVRRAWTDVVFCNWAPLTILSLQLDTSLFGTQPWGYHLTNVLVHAAATAFVYLAVVRMTAAPGRSLVAAALFGVHPLRVESVAWISERKDVLSVFFLAAALVAYERYCRRPGIWRYLAVAAAMLASLLTKATAVTLPLLLLVLDAWPLRRANMPGLGKLLGDSVDPPSFPTASWRRLCMEKLPLFVLAAIFAVITIATQATAIQGEEKMPLWQARIPNAVIAIGTYLWETALPIRLHPAHQHSGAAGISPLALMAAIVTIAAVAWLAVRLRHSVPACAAGLAWFFLALSPVLGIVTQQGFQAHADRFTYVPHIGLMVAVVWTAAHLLKRWKVSRRASTGLALAAIVCCSILSRGQIAIWRNSLTVWNQVLSIEPTSALAHMNLGTAHYDRGEIDVAIAAFRRSLAIRPTALAQNWLGIALAETGRPLEAYEAYAAATMIDPAFADGYNNAGTILARMGRMREAIERFERAAALSPNDQEIQQNVARAKAELREIVGP